MRKKASSESRSTAYACRALPEGYDLYKSPNIDGN